MIEREISYGYESNRIIAFLVNCIFEEEMQFIFIISVVHCAASIPVSHLNKNLFLKWKKSVRQFYERKHVAS